MAAQGNFYLRHTPLSLTIPNMSQKTKILNESPDRDLLELREEHISLRTHEDRMNLTELTMLAALTKEISHTDAKLIYHAIDLSSRMEERVQKAEEDVSNIILRIARDIPEDPALETELAEFEVLCNE